MESQVLNEKVQWEARRVAAAFGVETWHAVEVKIEQYIGFKGVDANNTHVEFNYWLPISLVDEAPEASDHRFWLSLPVPLPRQADFPLPTALLLGCESVLFSPVFSSPTVCACEARSRIIE